MGYNTNFSGHLKFTRDLKASELAMVQDFLEEDCREHPEWAEAYGEGYEKVGYIDLVFTPTFSGLEWNGAEKTYDMVECVNVIIKNMRRKDINFGLKGEMLAQGEEIGDIWKIIIKDGLAIKEKIFLNHNKFISCPQCGYFFTEEENA